MPAYDRATPVLEAEPAPGAEASTPAKLSQQRCFNCGSYTHSLQARSQLGFNRAC